MDMSNPAVVSTESLMKRVSIFLEDGDMKSADEYCERVLDIDPENASAYVGKLMAELGVRKRAELARLKEPFCENKNYIKAIRFGDEALAAQLRGYLDSIAAGGVQQSKKEENVAVPHAMCQGGIEIREAAGAPISAYANVGVVVYSPNECSIESVNNQGGKKVVALIIVAVLIFVGVMIIKLVPEMGYQRAARLVDGGNYSEAYEVFSRLGDYKDSPEQLKVCKYNMASSLLKTGSYDEAYSAFAELEDYSDSYEKSEMARIASRGNACMIAADRHHTVAVKSNGTMLAVGNNINGQCNVFGWSDIIAVSAGDWHTLGLKSNGTVIATKILDEKDYGQSNVDSWTGIIGIAAGRYHSVGLREDGTVVAVGTNSHGQCNVFGWTNIVAVSAGTYHTVGLKADGTVVATALPQGDNENYGQSDISGWSDIVAISAGGWHTVGVRSDGTVVSAGADGFNRREVSSWAGIVAVSAGFYHTAGLKADGTVVATQYVGDYYAGQCNVAEWRDIVAIASGGWHTVGLKSDGTVVATSYTGATDYNQCGVSEWSGVGR